MYLSVELREKYGERFHVVEYDDRIELIPVADDPLQAVRDEVGDTFEDRSLGEVRSATVARAESRARRDLDPGAALFRAGRGVI